MKINYLIERKSIEFFNKLNESRMILIVILTLIYSISGICLKAQGIDFCGSLPFHQASSSSPDSIYYDRFGNTYDLYPSTQNLLNSTKIYAGYFDIDFSGPNSFIDVIRRVFDTLSIALPRKTNYNDCNEIIGQELVSVQITTTLGVSYLAAASPSWLRTNWNKCSSPLLINEFNLVINSGKGKSIFGYDGTIDIRLFASNSPEQWNLSYTAQPTATQYDLKSVLMHEALHLYGFSSLITSTGGGDPSIGAYDLYDNYIYRYQNNGLQGTKIIVGNCQANCWALNPVITDFNSLVLNNCTANSNFILGMGGPYIAPLNGANGISGSGFGNYLSHLHPNCLFSDPNYIMQPTIGLERRRVTITEHELDILCSLGYSNSLCNGCHIGAFKEFDPDESNDNKDCCSKIYSACINETISIPFSDLLCNDVSGDTKTITDVFYHTFQPITVNIVGTNIEFSGTVEGSYEIQYTVTGCDCKQHNATFRAIIRSCDCNVEDPCINLSCSNGFEEFKVMTGSYSLVRTLSGVFWVFNNFSQNSPDVCSNNGNKYAQMYSSGSLVEGIAIKLDEVIQPGCKINLSLKGATSQGTTQLVVLASTFPPCNILNSKTNVGCTSNNCSYDPECLVEIPITNIVTQNNTYCPNNFTFVDYPYSTTNTTGKVINYIILYPKNEGGRIYQLYIDDVVITKDCACAEINKPSNQIECNKFEFVANECNPGNLYSWNFGDPNSGSNSSTSNPALHTFSDNGTYTVTLTVSDECGNTKTDTEIVEINCPLFTCDCPSGFEEIELINDDITNLIPNSNIVSFQDKCIKIKGKIVINKNFSFGTCKVLLEPGAEIEVKSGFTFTASRCHFSGCTKMWKSITALPGSFVSLNFDTIQDAEFGLHALGGSTIKLQYNHFFRNYVGAFADGGVVNNSSPMIGNRFYTNGAFLPSFNGQQYIPSAYGYCGVWVKNAVFSIGSLSSGVNYFYDLYNGVIGENSDLTVAKANIHDLITIRSRLLQAPKFSYADGDGIFTSTSTLTALSNTISVTNGAITDYQGKSHMSFDNKISNTVSGIYCAYPKLECYMDKNQIKNYYLYGIGVNSPQGKIELMITRTDTFSSSTSSTQPGGSTAIILENVIASKLAQVQANKMLLDPYANGIILRNCQNIGLQENYGTYNGITARNGVGLFTSFSNVVYGNRIEDTVSTPRTLGNAFYFNDSRTNKVCCNYSSGTRSGFHFANTSTMLNLLRTNQINHHRIGLECDTTASIELQSNGGNRWSGNYTNYSAAHFGSAFYIRTSRFHIATCTTQVWPKNPIFPTQTCRPIGLLNNDWFRQDGDGLTASCSTDTLACRKPFSTIVRKTRGVGGGGGGEGLSDDGSRNATDTLIATRNMTVDNSFEARTVWEMSFDLLYRLKTHPAICEEDSIMNSHVLYNDTTNLGKFVQVDLDLDTLLSLSDSVSALLQLRLYVIDSARMEIQIIDSILISGSVSEEDSIALDSQRMEWSIMTYNANLQMDTILANYEEERESALEQLETDLSDITPSSIIESNRKAVLTIYLNSSIRGHDTLTTAQFEDISEIANSCARSGGRSVILARQLYLLNEYFDFNEDSTCQYEPEPIVLNAKANQLSKEQLSVYPNPSNGNFILEVKHGAFPFKSQLYIYDLKGREVFHKLIDKECKRIEITKADLGVVEGIFICKLISTKDLLYSPKIILHK
jgi:PKD repeat protein